MQTEKEYFAGRVVTALRCESTGEYSLPDYNGDVKKVLLVKAKAFPSGKFAGDDSLEFSGTVGYEVVYVDADNTVTHAEFSTDYDAAMRINSESYILSLYASPRKSWQVNRSFFIPVASAYESRNVPSSSCITSELQLLFKSPTSICTIFSFHAFVSSRSIFACGRADCAATERWVFSRRKRFLAAVSKTI